jgi:DNA-binding MarR family transcriptional regulator
VNTEQTLDLLPSQLRLAIMRLARRLRQEAGSDITWSQQSALASVERLGPISLKDLAEVENITPPSMTRISTHLEERGLVVRAVDAADRRVAHLAITDDGRLLLAKTRSRRDAYLAERLQALAPEDRATLQQALPLLEHLMGESK